ncbi:hypothetical protein GFS31_08520 [Leptolyngbya sp. BL0902]|uniref:hypothetical protein n=1 Tax=Leptolyngbya sp. BL0902 TaxID=1115757 RepID=UPI0018E7432D|nr:hypothetical protein [Leptolyngbya sp. BL0902]QQE64173.1 hypothetical protein GFS31_08520 [Leptolyngbya sp. BL0902]
MTQQVGYHGNSFEHNLSPAEKEIIRRIRDRIHKKIDHVSPATAYELSQILGLVAQVARTKDIDDQKPGFLHSAVSSLFGNADISVPREELLEILETTSIVLTEGLDEEEKYKRQRLIFSREIIHKIDIQSRHFPNPVSSLLARYNSLEDRLLSGTVWFFNLFFVVPSLLVLSILVVYTLKTYNVNGENIKNNLNTLISNNSVMTQSLRDIDSQLDEILPPVEKAEGAEQNPNPSETNSVESINVPISILSEIDGNVTKALQNQLDYTHAATATQNLLNGESSKQSVALIHKAILEIFGIQSGTLPMTGILALLIAITMGALGGSVSVIMTSDKLVNETKRKKVDPFYIGFFRPFIGMAFAIFVVSLIESGIFSSFLELEKPGQQNEKLYLFAAIAFVAGFSERFAPSLADQVSRVPSHEELEPKDE